MSALNAQILQQIERVQALALRYERAAAAQNAQLAEVEDIIRQVNGTLHGTNLGTTLAQETGQDLERIRERAMHFRKLAEVCKSRAAALRAALEKPASQG